MNIKIISPPLCRTRRASFDSLNIECISCIFAQVPQKRTLRLISKRCRDVVDRDTKKLKLCSRFHQYVIFDVDDWDENWAKYTLNKKSNLCITSNLVRRFATLPSNKLVYLDLKNIALNARTASDLVNLSPQLIELGLSDCLMLDSGMDILATKGIWRALLDLDFSEAEIGIGQRMLVDLFPRFLKRCPQLENLYVCGMNGSSDMISAITSVNLGSLQRFNCANSTIDGMNGHMLATNAGAHWPNLKMLIARGCRWNSEQLIAFSKVGLPSVEELVLGDGDDEGGVYTPEVLAALKVAMHSRWPMLKILHVPVSSRVAFEALLRGDLPLPRLEEIVTIDDPPPDDIFEEEVPSGLELSALLCASRKKIIPNWRHIRVNVRYLGGHAVAELLMNETWSNLESLHLQCDTETGADFAVLARCLSRNFPKLRSLQTYKHFCKVVVFLLKTPDLCLPQLEFMVVNGTGAASTSDWFAREGPSTFPNLKELNIQGGMVKKETAFAVERAGWRHLRVFQCQIQYHSNPALL